MNVIWAFIAGGVVVAGVGVVLIYRFIRSVGKGPWS